ncbi:hypothetical protein [Halobacillus ihumii]|uniref:hypothetical protein n=1 Tax=Halobacillus ihumii TaxID=2686092 RepID=UPI0013D453F5|nr:hypothetical protein [Halobacillus ihumii]
MSDMKRVDELWESMFKSMHQEGHGIYDRIDLDIDDFKFLIDLSKQQHDLIERHEKAVERANRILCIISDATNDNEIYWFCRDTIHEMKQHLEPEPEEGRRYELESEVDDYETN